MARRLIYKVEVRLVKVDGAQLAIDDAKSTTGLMTKQMAEDRYRAAVEAMNRLRPEGGGNG